MPIDANSTAQGERMLKKRQPLPPSQLVDRHNRHLNYLRVSVTDRCNLRCIYCTPREAIHRLPHAAILSYEEILRIVRVGVDLGISKLRITGGEPLVRKGLCELLTELTHSTGLRDVSLTTNGVLLSDHLAAIRSAGIRRINISLDTLNPQKYRQITGRDAFHRVREAIRQAEAQGFHPIKINVVALRGINDDELLDLARLAVEHPYHVRFIEHMPMGGTRYASDRPLLIPEIKHCLRTLGRFQPVASHTNDGPARRYRFEGARGEIGFISAMSQHFCDRCNRLRLTASGQLRPCLLSEAQVDVKDPLRQGCSDMDLARLFLSAVRLKPSDHNLTTDAPIGTPGPMSSIGG
jgi:cyclic pyranopterin phosphate synthase